MQVMDVISARVEQLEEYVGGLMSETDLYIAHPHAKSYGWHFDRVSNIVYCVEGSKTFQVAGTVPYSDVALIRPFERAT